MAKNKLPIFLGIADHSESANKDQKLEGDKRALAIAIGQPIDIFGLSNLKHHFFFPAMLHGQLWCFLLPPEFLKSVPRNWRIEIIERNGKEKFHFDIALQQQHKTTKDMHNAFLMISIEAMIPSPKLYDLYYIAGNKRQNIGFVDFRYLQVPPLTADQVSALSADIYAPKAAVLTLGCKHCTTKMPIYTSIERSPELERKATTWQHDVKGSFKCSCGATQYSLQYIRESLHALLFTMNQELKDVSYSRRYGHQQIASLVKKFNELILKENNEAPVQKFIEANTIMLAAFYPKRLLFRPSILGKFVTDFVLLDAKGQLCFIEIEKPSLKLFTKHGHPSQPLMHAYHQVNDWLDEFTKHKGAVLEGLGFKDEQVLGVRGVVIAGIDADTKPEHLKRHFSKPPFPQIEFMTFDQLANTVLQVSKKLA